MYGNSYYKLTEAKVVWVKTGSRPGNSYYGAAQIHDVLGQQVTLNPGDELHLLIGGLFAVTANGVFEVLHKSPSELNMHFCKDYTPRSWYEERICASGTTEISRAHAKVPASYR